MFERFTREARHVVTGAQQESRQLNHSYIGTEHLLLALLDQQATTAFQVLSHLGLTYEQAVGAITDYVGTDELDAEALETLGIDLGAVRERVETTFGEGALDRPPPSRRGRKRSPRGHIPFTPRAKKVLELSLREALALKHNHITDGHILLGLLREDHGVAMKVINSQGISSDVVRTEIMTALS